MAAAPRRGPPANGTAAATPTTYFELVLADSELAGGSGGNRTMRRLGEHHFCAGRGGGPERRTLAPCHCC